MGWDDDLIAARAAMLKPLGKGLHGAIAPSHAPAVHALGQRIAADPSRDVLRPGNSKLAGPLAGKKLRAGQRHGRHAARIAVTRGVPGVDCPHRTEWCGQRCYAGVLASRAAGGRFAGGHGVAPAYSWLAHHAPADLADRLIREVMAAGVDVVRIHDAGDFVSPAHVWAYHAAALATPNTVWFGFTRAWRDASPEWRDALAALAALPNVRLRASGDPEASPSAEDAAPFWGRAVVMPKGAVRPEGAFTCLEQVGKAASCADCGACWRTRATVAFLEH